MNIEELKKRKKELGLTNQQLAAISGVSLGTVNKVFSGATKSPQLDTLNALIDALDMTHTPQGQPDRLGEPPIPYHTNTSHTKYTLADYDSLPEDTRAELIDGEITMLAAPTVAHQAIIGELFYQIYHHIRGKSGPCKVLLSPISVCLNKDEQTALEPDLVILCDPDKSDGKRIWGAPDFIAEVVSPSSRKTDYLVKLNKYWTAGVKEYWIIDPEQEKITVYSFAGEGDEFETHIYTFKDQVPVGIYDNLVIDFRQCEV